MGGKPVRGFGISERSLALYRDWELVEVLAASLNQVPGSDGVAPLVGIVRPLVLDGKRTEALDYLASTVAPAIESVPGDTGLLRQILDDLTAALA
jgi:hypothetical protein